MMQAMPNTDPQNKGGGNDYVRFIGVGFAFILILAFFTGIGIALDLLIRTAPLFLLIGLAAGFMAALYYVYLQMKTLGGG